MRNSKGQSSNVGSSTLQVQLNENNWSQLVAKIDRPTVCFKYLVSKYLFSEDDFTEIEKIALFVSFEKLVILCSRDNNSAQKYNFFLFAVRSIVQSLNNKIYDTETRAHQRKLIEPMLSNRRGFFSAGLYYGLKRQIEVSFNIYVKIRQPKKFKPKQFVGVGYNDKGSCQSESYDGSPHWTEVAQANINGETETVSLRDKETNFWNQLLIHEMQRINNP